MKKNLNKILVVLLLGLSIASIQNSAAAQPLAPDQQSGCQTFTETGKAVCGRFLQYWQTNGGLAQQGFPISGLMGEKSPVDGKVRTVQYFERAEFEYHPENEPPNDVQLSLLGTFRYQQKYPTGASGQVPNVSTGSVLFKETGHRLGGVYLEYWQQHGGLAQQGYPISDVFAEKSDLDGKTYPVQYFERAVFEYHLEIQATTKVLLSQLGTFRYQQLSSAGGWVAPPRAVPPAMRTPSPTPIPRATPMPAPDGVTIRGKGTSEWGNYGNITTDAFSLNGGDYNATYSVGVPADLQQCFFRAALTGGSDTTHFGNLLVQGYVVENWLPEPQSEFIPTDGSKLLSNVPSGEFKVDIGTNCGDFSITLAPK